MEKILCITGVPGTGKTTICQALRSKGIICAEGNDLAREAGCLSGDEVDVDCLSSYLRSIKFSGVIAAHYSHLLPCDRVIVLEAEEKDLIERMKSRSYNEEKIDENLDVQRSSSIYYEALDRLPANRIFTIKNDDIDETLNRVIEILNDLKL